MLQLHQAEPTLQKTQSMRSRITGKNRTMEVCLDSSGLNPIMYLQETMIACNACSFKRRVNLLVEVLESSFRTIIQNNFSTCEFGLAEFLGMQEVCNEKGL